MRLLWSCPSRAALARGLGEGLSARQTRHLAGCARCRDICQGARHVLAVAWRLPVATMGRAARARIADGITSAALGIDADPPRPAARAPLRRAATGLATLAVLFGLGGAAATRHQRVRAPAHAAAPPAAAAATVPGAPDGSLRGYPGAKFHWIRGGPDALVAVAEGTVEVDARRRVGERFRIVTADAEVDAAGAHLVLTVVDHRLAGVHVVPGAAELTSRAAAGRPW